MEVLFLQPYEKRFVISIIFGGLTVCVSCGGWEGGFGVETGEAQSQTNAEKRGAYPPSATRCVGRSFADGMLGLALILALCFTSRRFDYSFGVTILASALRASAVCSNLSIF
jgi:hypothetical protein